MNTTTIMENEISIMKWYIVKSQSNRERSVCEKITKESEKGDLKIGKILVPMEKNFVLKSGKKVVKEKVMYPGYIFVQTDAIGELTHFVKGCDGATGLLATRSGDIQSIPESEINRMIGEHKVVEEKVLSSSIYINGEEVKIVEGPFSGFFGIVDSIQDQKIKVAVLIFGRKTLVELSANQIDKK